MPPYEGSTGFSGRCLFQGLAFDALQSIVSSLLFFPDDLWNLRQTCSQMRFLVDSQLFRRVYISGMLADMLEFLKIATHHRFRGFIREIIFCELQKGTNDRHREPRMVKILQLLPKHVSPKGATVTSQDDGSQLQLIKFLRRLLITLPGVSKFTSEPMHPSRQIWLWDDNEDAFAIAAGAFHTPVAKQHVPSNPGLFNILFPAMDSRITALDWIEDRNCDGQHHPLHNIQAVKFASLTAISIRLETFPDPKLARHLAACLHAASKLRELSLSFPHEKPNDYFFSQLCGLLRTSRWKDLRVFRCVNVGRSQKDLADFIELHDSLKILTIDWQSYNPCQEEMDEVDDGDFDVDNMDDDGFSMTSSQCDDLSEASDDMDL